MGEVRKTGPLTDSEIYKNMINKCNCEIPNKDTTDNKDIWKF
jgi:hypothetical protein